MSKLEEKIIQKGQSIIESINLSAKHESEALKHRLIEEARADLEVQFHKAQQKAKAQVEQAKQEGIRSLRDEVAISKQQLIESIFTALKEELKHLNKEDYFNYVVRSIQNQAIDKTEEIQVNKKEYALYQSILTTKKGDLVEADLLNQKLGKDYQLKLSNTPAQIESGFMLVGKLYDLNFSLENLLESLTKKYEKTIYEALN
ncbi:hypothetical protein [Acholeplasma laidlawii]|uniref:hypothetical protein n=1 Tax=Acholeplasma laidlawii TaxID=2148 RepID=UPI00084C9837|nr:hypothetical protein [Acholeplasma laidlawii]OED59309.1 hypothetical protein BHS12_04235 [Acholeplasma laidlawii]